MIKLERNNSRYNFNADTNKYHINCDEIKKDPDKYILPEYVIKNKSDISILKSVINPLFDKISPKQKHIVVKIGKTNKTIEKEFQIGNLLETNNIPGFIHYMCLFRCYDNTYQIIENNKDIVNNLKICKANSDEDNIKSILVMPFIPEKSIKNFKWNKYNSLKSIIQQTLLSICIAYHKLGFIHNDLHLDNILIKKTKKEYIRYDFTSQQSNDKIILDIKTYGYTVVIMDFDSSFINVDKQQCYKNYWYDIMNMILRLNIDLENNDGDKINIIHLSKISSFIEQNIKNNISYMKTIKLIEMIDNIEFTIIKKPTYTVPVYNPNVFI
jgi:serine/threonine protein kinase